jgi:hypothetical protein
MSLPSYDSIRGAVQVGQVSTPVQEVRAVSFHELSLPSPTIWSSAENVVGEEHHHQTSEFVRFHCYRTESAEEDDVRSGHLIFPR